MCYICIRKQPNQEFFAEPEPNLQFLFAEPNFCAYFFKLFKELNKYNNKIMGQSNIMKYRMQKAT